MLKDSKELGVYQIRVQEVRNYKMRKSTLVKSVQEMDRNEKESI